MVTFQENIKNYLDEYAKNDAAFAVSYAKPKKSIDECCKYIMEQARQKRTKNESCVAVEDAEVYGWAVHYYDEDDIEVNGNAAASVSVSTSAQPTAPVQTETEEPKPKAKRKSKKKAEPKPIEVEPVEAEAEENVAVDIQVEESADDEFEIEPLEIPIF